MNYEVSGLGNALMDVIVRLDSLDELRGVSLKAGGGLTQGQMHLVEELEWHDIFDRLRHYPHETHPGGSCANVICTTALLGAETIFCGQVGRDYFGDLYAEAIGGICGGHRLHRLEGGHTGKCLSLITPDAERTMITTLGCAINLEPENVFLQQLTHSRFFHFTAYCLTGASMKRSALAALRHAKSHGVKISFDVADTWVIEHHRDEIWEIIERYADVVFTNEAEAHALCGGSPEEALHRLSSSCEHAIVKLGKRGSLIQSGREVHGIESFQVEAVDTTGAGDAYAGGYLHGLVRGLDPTRCGRLASRVAAETVSQTGAVVTAPGRLHALMEGI